MRENVVREFIEMSTAYAKDTAHVRKQFETPPNKHSISLPLPKQEKICLFPPETP
jgi:hypothetical protein